MWDYTDAVKEHFLNPKNVGNLPGANGVGEVGSLACGDALKLFLKIENDRIVDAKFLTFGCASAIASSSALTEMIKGKTVEEALKITNKDIAASLGGLPKEKMHCSVMGQEALEAAVRNYKGEPAVPHAHEGKLVCKCFGVTDEQIKKAVLENNLRSVEEVTHYTKAGGGCTDCLDAIQEIVDQVLGGTVPGSQDRRDGIARTDVATEPRPRLTNVQRMQQVIGVLDTVVRPQLHKDGGDIELVDIQGSDVYVTFKGMCSHCPSSRVTLENFVQKVLRDQVDPDLMVKEA